MCNATGMTNSVVAGAAGGGKMPEAPGQMPPVKGGGSTADLLPQLESIMAALKALVEKIGGGAAAAVAGASGDAAGSGPVKDAKSGKTDVAQSNGGPGQHGMHTPSQAPTKVAGDSGPGQSPMQKPNQVGGHHGAGHGVGHLRRRGKGHHKHMAPFPFPGQTPAKDGGKVGGETGGPVQQHTPVQAPAKTEPAKSKPVEAPVTQVAGDSGAGKKEPTQVESATSEPVKSEPVKSEPTQSGPDKSAPVQAPVTQVAGDSGSEPAPAVVTQSPSQSQPVQKAPAVGDVKLLELDHDNVMQLVAADGSYLYFSENSVSYHSRTGLVREAPVPASGFSVSLSDGTKVSYGLHDKTAWGETAGTPRDLEVLSSDGQLSAARTDDGDSADWVETPLTSFHLLELASMLFDGSYAKFGSGSGDVVQQSGSVVQQTA